MSGSDLTEWTMRPLGDLARVYSGGTPLRSNPSYWDGSIPWVTTTEISFGVIKSARQTISEAGLKASAARLAPPGTILIAMYGQGKTRGKSAILGIHAAMNQACAAVEVGPGLLPSYLLQYLAAHYDEIRSLSNSGSQENLSGQIIKKIPVLVPPQAEQQAIAEALEDKDELIDTLERVIAKKQVIKQGMMQQLLTGRTRLPGFTEPWSDVELGRIATINMGQSPAGSSYNTSRRGMPLVQGNAYITRRRTIKRLWTTQPTKRCRAGDVVLTVRAPVGYTAVASCDACLGRGVCSVNTGRDNRYLFHSLVYAEPRWAVYEQGSTFTAVNSKEVRLFTIPWPTNAYERGAIALALDEADAELQVLQEQLAKARDIKQGMMQELLTGRIRLPVAETAA